MAIPVGFTPVMAFHLWTSNLSEPEHDGGEDDLLRPGIGFNFFMIARTVTHCSIAWHYTIRVGYRLSNAGGVHIASLLCWMSQTCCSCGEYAIQCAARDN